MIWYDSKSKKIEMFNVCLKVRTETRLIKIEMYAVYAFFVYAKQYMYFM
jgi:hypothetical protein